MSLFSVASFAANVAFGCAGTGPGVMIVSATCTLLYTGSEGGKLCFVRVQGHVQIY